MFLERTTQGHRQSDQHWNRFKGNVGETSEGRGGAHMGFSERINTTLNWTKCTSLWGVFSSNMHPFIITECMFTHSFTLLCIIGLRFMSVRTNSFLCRSEQIHFCVGQNKFIFLCSVHLSVIIIIIMYIYHALMNALSAHMIHIKLNIIFYAHVEHSPTKTIYIKYYLK